MKKELPKVFANNITKEIKNNEKIYNSKTEQSKLSKSQIKQETNEKIKNIEELKQNKTKSTIIQKINKIMNTKEYIYKIPVKIKTKEKEIITKLIGKNAKYIITIENELIRIEEILDIEKYEE